jgi:Lon protease-like protein
MSATTDFDRQRIRLEEIIACNIGSRRTLLEMLQDIYEHMVTERERQYVTLLDESIKILEEQHRYLVDFHPDKLTEVER